MKEPKFSFFTTNELKPEGWLKRQLQIQAEGLSGHLDLIWPDIRESKWIGGDKEGWERVPYWLDGFIPLAFLLDDENMKSRAKKFIDAILDRQEEDGWICPCEKDERSRYDVWPVFLIGKVLVLYYECTQDNRIEDAVYRAMRQLLKHISVNTIFNWAATRWYECLIPLFWLYKRRPEPWILELVTLLEAEGMDFQKIYERFEFERPELKKYWTQINHVVNAAMALKSRALMSRITDEKPDEFAMHMYQTIMKHNSMVIGHFTGDECFSGNQPIQGSECCSIAEAMYSYEILLSISGNCFWGDLLEKLAFNGMPATTTTDMWAHQYVQLTNQISAAKIPEEFVPFNSNNGEAHMFGLEPHFGCCTANFNQAWPKFVLSAIMKGEKGIAINSMVPVNVTMRKENSMVSVRIVTDYPFKDEGIIEIETDKPTDMEVLVRIPGFAQKAWVDEKEVKTGEFFCLNKRWEGKTRIPVRFGFKAEFVDRPNQTKALVRGPLVFSLPIAEKVRRIEYIRDGVERKYPYCDYEMLPDSDWNYGFASEYFEVIHEEVGSYPFSTKNPPVKIAARMVKIPWREENGTCKCTPEETKAIAEPEMIQLQPYGCTNLRMTEMPFVQID
ncbi:MAG: glycoside hydrolase family 127 protein [Clostridiales bacterium]|nr:glycoside hydrolase family 127 protein [Clostridiales bacterium]